MQQPHREIVRSKLRDRIGWQGLGLFAIALAVRLLHLWQIHDAPYFSLLLGDSEGYDAWAVRIAAGDWLGSDVFYQAPLYPYLLATIYALIGRDLLAVRLLQAVLGSVSCLLLAGAARRFLTRPAGWVAGLLLALYPTAVFFDARIDKSSLDLFFVCLGLRLIASLAARPRRPVWWATGAAFGGLALTRENALALILAVVAWIGLDRQTGRGKATAALLFAFGLATVLLPVALRNGIVGGEPHLTTAQFGPNFYIGNNPQANGTYQPLRHGRGIWRYEQQDAIELAQEATGRELSPGEVSSYWTTRALDYITSRPVDWVQRKWLTFRLLWNAVELGDSEDQYTHAERSTGLRLLGFFLHFGTLAPLALFGLWISWRRRATLLPLYLMVAAYAVSVVAFYVLGRYRHPLVPLLLIFAAAALTGARQWWASTTARQIAPALAATALAAVFCNWPMVPKDSMRAATHLNIANALQAVGEQDEAMRHLQQVVLLEPDFAVAHYNLGNLFRSRGEEELAIEHYRRAVQILPEYFEAYNNWGVLLLDQVRLDEAAALFRRVLEIEPGSALAGYNLGNVLRLKGDLDGAIEQYRRVLRIQPSYVPAQRALERTQQSKRMPDPAPAPED